MAEAGADDLERYLGAQHQRCRRVSEVAEADGAEGGGCHQPVEGLRDLVGRLKGAIAGGEDEVLVVVGGSVDVRVPLDAARDRLQALAEPSGPEAPAIELAKADADNLRWARELFGLA